MMSYMPAVYIYSKLISTSDRKLHGNGYTFDMLKRWFNLRLEYSTDETGYFEFTQEVKLVT